MLMVVGSASASQAKLTEGFNAAVDVDHAVQCGFGALDFPKLQQLKDKINSRQLPPPQLTQLPPYAQRTFSFSVLNLQISQQVMLI
eukprot:COSAG02_NODE_879_length_16244_cov_15.397956_2_plen_86_part_00